MKIVVAVLGATLVMTACGDGAATPECVTDGIRLDSGVFYVDLRCGSGEVAEWGDSVEVDYVGELEDGTEFDSTATRGEPYRFALGDPNLIEGWDDGIAGMRVGGRRRIVIPPELAYADDGLPPDVPPGATLIFEVDLLAVMD